MSITRRGVLGLGGGIVATLSLPGIGRAQGTIEIAMTGTRDGSRVWFDPIGFRIEVGQAVRWTNRDAGNSHTATAYHPDVAGRPLRIPQDAQPWDSGYLLPDETYSLTLSVPGVYDYYCSPHEMAGMAGRIVVGRQPEGWTDTAFGSDGVPEAALQAFPSVEKIMAKGVVRRG